MKKFSVLLTVFAVFLASAGVSSAADSATVRAFIERGKKFSEAKDYNSAIKTWSKVLDEDPLNEEALTLIGDAKFKADYQVAVLDRLNKEERLKTPYAAELSRMAGEMSDLLDKAKSKIGEKNQDANASAVTTQQAVDSAKEAQATLRRMFENGVGYYSQGDYSRAIDEWEKIAATLPGGEDLKRRIAEIRGIMVSSANPSSGAGVAAAAAPQAASETAAPEAEKQGLAQIGRDLEKILREAFDKIHGQADEARRMAAEQKQKIEESRTQSASALSRGNKLYESGDVEGAIREWRSALPHLQDADRLAPLLDRLESEQRVLSAAPAGPAADVKTETPKEFTDALKDRMQRISAKKAALTSSAAEREKAAADRQTAVRQALENGRVLMTQDRVEEALSLWESVAGDLKDEVNIRRLIAGVRQAAKDLESAQAGDSKTETEKLSAPAELSAALEKLNARFRQEAAQVSLARSADKKLEADRKAFVDGKLSEGRRAYEAGHWNEALAAWRELIPYFQDGKALEAALESIRKSAADLEAARTAGGISAGAPRVSQDFLKYLDREAQSLRSQKSAAESILESASETKKRQEQFETAVEEGKKLAEAGDIDVAARVWKDAAALIPGDKEAAAGLRQLETAYREKAAAKAEAAKKAAEVPILAKPAVSADAAPVPRAAVSVSENDEVGRMFAEVDQIQKRYHLNRTSHEFGKD